MRPCDGAQLRAPEFGANQDVDCATFSNSGGWFSSSFILFSVSLASSQHRMILHHFPIVLCRLPETITNLCQLLRRYIPAPPRHPSALSAWHIKTTQLVVVIARSAGENGSSPPTSAFLLFWASDLWKLKKNGGRECFRFAATVIWVKVQLDSALPCKSTKSIALKCQKRAIRVLTGKHTASGCPAVQVSFTIEQAMCIGL